MRVIFVGSLVDRKTLECLPDASVAGNKMQMGFVKGFIHAGIPVNVISAEPHGMWKANKKPIIVKQKNYDDEGVRIRTIPYMNFWGIKQLSIFFNVFMRLWKIKREQELFFVVYNTMSMFAVPVLCMSKIKGAKSVAIVADLPLQGYKSFLQKIEDKQQQKLICKFDVLIPLTESIVRDFGKGKPYIVVEAGCNPNDYQKKVDMLQAKPIKDVVFSGTLNQLSGIELIISAMRKVNHKSIRLHIYGDGPLRTFVEKAVNECDNIFYHGHVSNDEMIQIQKKADLLVCPRCKDNFTTKYTFPSKILEYICSGVPVLSNRLEGIPVEYENYVNFSESELPEDWSRAIYRILIDNPEFYRAKACEARDYVLNKKSWDYHGDKIVAFFKQCL